MGRVFRLIIGRDWLFLRRLRLVGVIFTVLFGRLLLYRYIISRLIFFRY